MILFKVVELWNGNLDSNEEYSLQFLQTNRSPEGIFPYNLHALSLLVIQALEGSLTAQTLWEGGPNTAWRA